MSVQVKGGFLLITLLFPYRSIVGRRYTTDCFAGDWLLCAVARNPIVVVFGVSRLMDGGYRLHRCRGTGAAFSFHKPREGLPPEPNSQRRHREFALATAQRGDECRRIFSYRIVANSIRVFPYFYEYLTLSGSCSPM